MISVQSTSPYLRNQLPSSFRQLHPAHSAGSPHLTEIITSSHAAPNLLSPSVNPLPLSFHSTSNSAMRTRVVIIFYTFFFTGTSNNTKFDAKPRRCFLYNKIRKHTNCVNNITEQCYCQDRFKSIAIIVPCWHCRRKCRWKQSACKAKYSIST